MFNKIKNLFKKPKPFIQEDWSNAERAMKEALSGRYEKGTVYINDLGVLKKVKSIQLTPKLTKSELIALHSCMEFAIKGKEVGLNAGVRPAMTMKRLTDKGYLVRVKRGIYKLSFIK